MCFCSPTHPLAQSIERTDKPAFEIIQTRSGYPRAQRTRPSKNVDPMPQMFDLFDDRHPCITAKKLAAQRPALSAAKAVLSEIPPRLRCYAVCLTLSVGCRRPET
ncbi:hypothetical protein C1Y08_21270 [Pseudomonas sp. FW306-02-F02-AA]|nr:hypothetical protein C1Y07_17370 [Pseudomonas sp. FW306-02-F02-AB]PMZ08470.1 hypothetical protein C1Y06_18820 [Pseudomonas sp. FW306-02-H06C]PMZ13880.1 hypothetical protein C1Y08_21270 [Pseudomonas sp. FW306-02-F02-AA]PMZ20560.1 hypothetical protein C1Y09_17820 [Pseudomonas sp. FW306-02-F08-AA]PMZ25634.1 hypothetical protein C1Y05_22010 [Pseudomonas sp. FW306-02-F04-BA]PMZ33201.1 hypothetical protein C1X99_17165 [Pseudomonas sp. FW306-02-H06B]PMZ39031.1 hypothetical protein C1Y00_18430 [Ps